jgi:hypothetical protein
MHFVKVLPILPMFCRSANVDHFFGLAFVVQGRKKAGGDASALSKLDRWRLLN